MSTEADRLLDETLRLPVNERARLAARLLGSLDDTREDEGWQAAWAEELTRRDREIETGEVRPLTLAETMDVVLGPGDEPER